jgi:glycosyltransferase involved in cell wall biosynthesis
MRIGIETSALAVDMGGTAAYVSNLLEGLACHRNDYQIETFSMGIRPLARKTVASRFNTMWRDLVWSQVVLPAVARQRWLDVLHLTGAAMPLWSDCPRVVTVHDVAVMRYREFFTPWMVYYARAIRARAIRRADAIITQSEFGRREIAQTLGIAYERITVVPLGVSGRFFDPPPAGCLMDVRVRFRLDCPFILHVGVLSPRKNLLRLMEAYRRLREARVIAHQLILAGNRGWGDDEVLRRASELDPEGRDIRFIGPVSADLPALYHLADLVVYPSLYETFGLPPLEAMACGTPVVASNVTAMPEVLGDAALLVDPTDEDALAETMHRALTSDSLREELTQRGRDQAAKFTWDRTVWGTLDVYKRVARSEGRGDSNV